MVSPDLDGHFSIVFHAQPGTGKKQKDPEERASGDMSEGCFIPSFCIFEHGRPGFEANRYEHIELHDTPDLDIRRLRIIGIINMNIIYSV